MMPSIHVLIIGGGVGGLALAQNLKKRAVSFTLFERDTSPAARAQGYRLRVAGAGAEGIRGCLDDELFRLFENTCAETKPPSGTPINALNGQPVDQEPPLGPPGYKPGQGTPGKGRPETMGTNYTVDRTMLRSLLLFGQEGHIKFNKSFSHYESATSGVTAFFTDGSSEQGSLLIGADGISSPVRRQLLPKVQYVDTGSRAIYGKTPLTDELVARFSTTAMNGMSIIKDEQGNMLFMEPVRFPKDAAAESNSQLSRVNDYVYWVFGPNPDDIGLPTAEFQGLSGPGAADLITKLTVHWHPSLKALFELQNSAQTAPLRLISAKPERPEWIPSANVVLMGDAIHAMMPAGGSGANCALADASLLGRIIAEEGVSEKSMGSFVDQMWEHALPYVDGSARAAVKLFGFKGFEEAKEVSF